MNTVITGPCLVTWNSTTFFSEGDVVVNMNRRTKAITTAQHGIVSHRHEYSEITVTFTPSGVQSEGTTIMGWLLGKSPGQSLVPGGTGNEKALVITPITNSGGASKIWTFHRAGPTAFGGVRLSAAQTQWGQITFTVLESLVSAGSFYSTGSFSAPTLSFDPTAIITLPCRLKYGVDVATLASGDLQMDSIAGWQVAFNLSLQNHVRESCGLADVTLIDLQVEVTGQAAQIYDHTGAILAESAWPDVAEMESLRPGQRPVLRQLLLATLTDDAATSEFVSDAEPIILMTGAEMTRCALAWGATSNRTLDAAFKCRPTFTTGAKTAMLTYSAI